MKITKERKKKIQKLETKLYRITDTNEKANDTNCSWL